METRLAQRHGFLAPKVLASEQTNELWIMGRRQCDERQNVDRIRLTAQISAMLYMCRFVSLSFVALHRVPRRFHAAETIVLLTMSNVQCDGVFHSIQHGIVKRIQTRKRGFLGFLFSALNRRRVRFQSIGRKDDLMFCTRHNHFGR